MSMPTMITDRTQADVDAFKSLCKKGVKGMTPTELSSFLANPHKGAYNYADLNRVGAAIAYLAGLLNSYGYAVSVTAKTDWIKSEETSKAEHEAYIADIQTIKAALYGTMPVPTSFAFMNYVQANNIELLMLEIEENIRAMAAAFQYCGASICGGDYL